MKSKPQPPPPRGRGRPTVEHKAITRCIRVDDATWKRWIAAASTVGISVTSMIRTGTDKEATRIERENS